MALGSGLDALFEDNATESKETRTLRMSEIEPNKLQPRKSFDEEEIRELAESIREHGLIQPIVVRPMPNGIIYQIVAGERRWRACRILGLSEVSVIIREMDDFEASQLAIIENIQRTDLNPVEEAAAYKALVDKYGMTQETLSKTIGKSRPYIANSMRLLALPSDVLDLLKNGLITTGHAKALMMIKDEAKMSAAAQLTVHDKLSVRDTEKLAVRFNSEGNEDVVIKAQPEDRQMKNFYTEMELSLKERLNRGVKIVGNGSGKGKITLTFEDKDDLCRLTEELVKIEG